MISLVVLVIDVAQRESLQSLLYLLLGLLHDGHGDHLDRQCFEIALVCGGDGVGGRQKTVVHGDQDFIVHCPSVNVVGFVGNAT